MFIDTHCHLSKEYYADIFQVLKENKEADVDTIIISGCDKESIKESLEYINDYSFVYATIGYHPSEVLKVSDADLEKLKKDLLNKKVVGVGEIGLDYHYGKEDRDKQLILFEKQLKIAEDLKKPVVIHSRDATKDTIGDYPLIITPKVDYDSLTVKEIYAFEPGYEENKKNLLITYEMKEPLIKQETKLSK